MALAIALGDPPSTAERTLAGSPVATTVSTGTLVRHDRAAGVRHGLFLLAWLAIVAWGLSRGAGYYLTPYGQRPFAPQYEQLRPAGTSGLHYGALGILAIAVGVLIYSVRKRARGLARAGKLKYWLEAHIFLCSVGPALVVLHTSFRVGGLVAIAFWSMVIVTLSGVFGRYVYVRIPSTVQGRFASLQAIERERARLLDALREDLGPRLEQIEGIIAQARRPPARGFMPALSAALRFDVARRRVRRRLRSTLAGLDLDGRARAEVEDLLERQLELEQNLAVLVPFQRLFRYWHLLHLPLAIAMFIVVAIHIAVAVAFGYGRIW
jgi:hypothetical protein